MNTLNLADYGIEQNKVETAKIQKLFDEAKEQGGLTVVVPKGTYIAGTLNIWKASVYLEKGAVLKASSDLADYVDNGFVHIENVRIDTNVRAGNWWGNGEAVELLALEHNYDGYLNPAPDRSLPVTIRDIQFKNLSCTSENVIAVIGEDNIEDVFFDGLYFEKKKSANRYLKGDRIIDVSPARVKVEVPEDGEYWLYSAGCRNLHIQNETIHAFEGKTLKAFVK